MGALRLKTGFYEKEAKQQGLQLLLKPKIGSYGTPFDQKSDFSIAPGFEEAPGFEPSEQKSDFTEKPDFSIAPGFDPKD